MQPLVFTLVFCEVRNGNRCVKELSQKQKAKRSQILAAAANAFLANGYEGTNLDQIISQTGGSKSTVYKYFENKEALFEAVAEYMSERSKADFDLALHQLVIDGELTYEKIEKALEDFAHLYLGTILTPDSSRPLQALIHASVDVPRAAKAFFRKGPLRAMDVIARHFRDWSAKGFLHVADETLAAEQFMGLLRANMLLRLLFSHDVEDRDPEEIKKIVGQAVSIFLRGACAPPGNPSSRAAETPDRNTSSDRSPGESQSDCSETGSGPPSAF